MAQEPAERTSNQEEQQPKRREFTPRGGGDRDRGGDRGDRGGDRGDRGPRGPRGGGPGGPRRGRFQPRRKVCAYCADPEKVIDWKNLDDLRRYISDSGGIFPRRKTGMCAKHQRHVAIAIKRARHIAVLPYTSEHVRVTGQGRN